MANSIRSFKINQGEDDKVHCEDAIVVRYGLSPSGRTTFVAAEARQPSNSKIRYRKRKATPAWEANKVWSICNFRLSGIQRAIVGRHHGPVDTADAHTYFEVALIHLVARRVAKRHAEEKIMSFEWAKKWTPFLAAEKGRDWFIDQEWRVLNAFNDLRPYIPSADEVAYALQIKAHEIEAYQIQTIGAVDRPEGVRIKEAQAKHTEREASRRAAQGARSRADSMARTKPWERAGVSRATYYRAVDRGEIQPDPRMKKRPGKVTATGNVLRLISES